MIPNAVHVWNIMTRAPRMSGGAHSAEYTGTVVLFGPNPKPRKKRATKRCGQEFVRPCQMQVTNEKMPAMKIVPRRPTKRFS